MKKKTEKTVVKPPFKVGVVHHRIFSPPPLSSSDGPSCSHSHLHSSVRSRIQQTAPVKRITRVTEKRLAAKAAARAAAKAAEKRSFAPANYKFKPPAGLPNIPLFGRVKKGSIDASKLSWNFVKNKSLSNSRESLSKQRKKSNLIARESPRNSKKFLNSQKENDSTVLNTERKDEPSLSNSQKSDSSIESLSKQRKKSNSIARESPRNSKKFRTSQKANDSAISSTEKKNEPSLSNSQKSDSSIDSLSLRVSSDDASVFDSPIAESPTVHHIDMQMKEIVYNFAKPIELNESLLKNKEESPTKLPGTTPNGKTVLLTGLEHAIPSPLLEPHSEMNSPQKVEKDPTDQVDSVQKADEAPEISSESEHEKMECSLSESAENPLDDSQNLAIFSPYVVTRRGKKEARKEQKLRRGLGQSPEEIPTKETVMQNLNISVDEEKRTSQYFKLLLERETTRLTEQCDFWTDIVSEENPPEEAHYIVQQAVGQTKLLLNKKFKRFETLVLDCELGGGKMLVTCKDLQGFWDMMYMEIKDCESRFQKLEELKAREWKEKEFEQARKPKRVPAKRKSSLKNKSPAKKKSPSKKAHVKSSLRSMILAARQKKKEMEENLETKPDDKKIVEIWNSVVKASPSKVLSTKRKTSITPQRITPKEKRASFSLALMAISQKCKTPEDKLPESKISLEAQPEDETEMDDEIQIVNVQVEMDQSISYINSKQTPGKSILKRFKVENTSNDSLVAKSAQKVNFNDNVELKKVKIDEEAKTKASLAVALTRIDSGEFDSELVPEMDIRAERKLNFEDESFNENINVSLKEDEVFNEEAHIYKTLIVPTLNVIPATPKSPRNKKKKSKVPSALESSILEKTIEEDAEATFTRSLRNRTIVGSLTPRSAKKMNVNLSS